MRTALVIDFDPKKVFEKNLNSKLDIFVLDRLKNKVVGMVSSNSEYNTLSSEIELNQLYQLLSKDYDQLFALYVSYSYSDINDYLVGSQFNQNRTGQEAKVYTYLLNYVMQNKLTILEQVIEMLEHDYSIKDIIIRIHNNRKKDVFSINDLINKYITQLY